VPAGSCSGRGSACSGSAFAKGYRGGRMLTAFRSLCTYLHRRGELTSIPPFPTVSIDEHAPRTISPDEQDRILTEIPEAARGLFLACARLGMRPGEARAVRVEDVDLASGWLTVARAQGTAHRLAIRGTKGGRVRRLPLDAELVAWIRVHAPSDGLLFRNPDATGLTACGFLARSATSGCARAQPRDCRRASRTKVCATRLQPPPSRAACPSA
jgi:integrase